MKKVALLIMVMALCVSMTALASPPDKWIGYSGFLRDQLYNVIGAGAPVYITLTFRMYTGAADPMASAVWVEEHTNVEVFEGEFSVQLGQITPFASVIDFSSTTAYWLGITIAPASQTFGELTPKKRLLFVPYAFDADDVVESRTGSDPLNPVTGQIWLRTDINP